MAAPLPSIGGMFGLDPNMRRRIGNVLTDFGGGLLQGKNFQQGLGLGAQQMAQMQPYRDQQEQMVAQQETQATQTNATINWLKSKGYDDLVAAVGGGLPIGDAWQEGLKRANPAPVEMTAEQRNFAATQADPAFAEFLNAPDPKEAFGNEKDLYAQYSSADPVKTYTAVRDGYERVRESAAQGTGAGDMGLIYGYMKMLDPGSVVRESEFAMAAQAGSYGEQIQGLVGRVINGERLPESVRQEFLQNADALYAQSAQNLGDINSQFSSRAQRWGVDPTRFIRAPEVYQPVKPNVPAGASVDDILKSYGVP
jgi:hypothetical protein